MPALADRHARTCLVQHETEELATYDNNNGFGRHVYLVYIMTIDI
jgi:hypothetical protein